MRLGVARLDLRAVLRLAWPAAAACRRGRPCSGSACRR